MSLIQSAHMNGHDQYIYLKDVLTRLPRQSASYISAVASDVFMIYAGSQA